MASKTDREDLEQPRSFEDSRTIDVNDRQSVLFWSRRLGVSEVEILEVVQEVGPNSTAVALKLEAPHAERTATPAPTPRP